MPDFTDLVDLVMKDRQFAGLRPVIEKEILHYDIMFALDREGLFENLVFQGGTSLRLCHGAPRFSEDLDFVGGHGFAAAQLREIRACVEGQIGKKYGLEVFVKEPKAMREEPSYLGIEIDRWQIAVVTNPGQPRLPRQRIKLEVANVPAYTSEPRAPIRNYRGLPAGCEDLLIPTETLREVMADKIVSLVASTEHIRNRDIWDLRWLKQKGAEIDLELVQKKIKDYHVTDYEEKLSARIGNLGSIIEGAAFKDEMGRFLPSEVRKRTLEKAGFAPFLEREVREMLEKARQGLYHGIQEPDFTM